MCRKNNPLNPRWDACFCHQFHIFATEWGASHYSKKNKGGWGATSGMDKHANSQAQITVNHLYSLPYSCCHSVPPSPAPPFPSSYVCVGNIHLMRTTNGTAVGSDWHLQHCGLTNHTTTLACQGADSFDFHKGSSMLIVYVCARLGDPEWPGARLAIENPTYAFGPR